MPTRLLQGLELWGSGSLPLNKKGTSKVLGAVVSGQGLASPDHNTGLLPDLLPLMPAAVGAQSDQGCQTKVGVGLKH